MKHIKSLFTLLLFILPAMPAFAQQKSKFHIASFRENLEDLTPKTHEKLDADGNPYAIIKVTSTNPDDDLSAYHFSFEHIPHVVEVKDGELWVYVGRNAMYVNISRDGYHSINHYELNTTIQAGRAYEMRLSVETMKVFRQMLEFNVKPAGVKAMVMVKGSKPNSQLERLGETDESGSLFKSLELGTYSYTIVTDNYYNSEGLLVLDKPNGHHVENISLRPKFSNVTLKAVPGAGIYINGERKGSGTWTGTLNAGTYSVECRMMGHKSAVETITIEENNDCVIELGAPVPIHGVLAVSSTPLGAKIKVDGKEYGTTPKNIDKLLVGSHEVEISTPNYKTEIVTVEIRENETTECKVTLSDKANVTISSAPKGAHLYINGKKMGTTPCKIELSSGDYKIKLQMSGYQDFEKTVHLSSSNPEVEFPLGERYVYSTNYYIGASGQFGSLKGAALDFGFYAYNFNVEVYCLYAPEKESVYINYSGTDMLPAEDKVRANFVYGGKIGYGIVLGTRCRLTPQLGAGMLSVSGDEVSSNAVTASLGLRCECALMYGFGISFTPEYSFTVYKQDVFKQLEKVSPEIKGWGNGFNARVGLYVFF